MILELIEQLVEAACVRVYFEVVAHDGPPARYTMAKLCCCGCGKIQHASVILTDGQSIHVLRDARLLIEPCDKLRARPPEVVLAQWVTT